MRTILWTLFLFCITSLSVAQDPEDAYNKGYQYLYSNRDSSYIYFQRAIDGYEELGDIDSELFSYHGLLYANGYFYDLQTYKINLQKYEDRIYGDDSEHTEYFTFFKDRLYLEKINYHFKLSEYTRAQIYIDSLTRFLDIRNEEERDKDYYDYSINAGLYQGSIYKNQNKVHLALDKYKQLESFIEKHKDSLYDYKNSIFSIQRLKAKAYTSLGDIDQAILSQLSALDVIESDDSYANSKLDIQTDLINNLVKSQELEDAKNLIKFLDGENIEKPIFKIRLLDQKINLSKIEGNRRENRRYHIEKLTELKNYREKHTHPDIINAYLKFSADELNWEDIASAFEKLNKTSSLLPSLDQNQNLQLTKLHLDLSAQYLVIYQNVKNITDHAEGVVLHSQNLLLALDMLQPQFESKLDKQYLIDTTYPALQNAFVLNYELYKATQNPSYLNQAFAISEKSKAIELRSIRQAGIAQRSLDLDPNIIEKENVFIYEINRLEKEQFTNDDVDQNIQERLLKQKEAYGNFVNELRESYPSYYNLRYNNDVMTLSDAGKQLDHQETIVSFLQVEDVMYVFKIDEQSPTLLKIPFSTKIQEQIREFYSAISKINVKEIEKYHSLSKQLYEILITPLFPDTLPQSLTIIPDGLLHYIPFETLNNGKDLLISQSTLSYRPSVSFQNRSTRTEPEESQFVGFAPSFKISNVLGLAPLHYNEEEVARANSFYKGVTFKGEDGSLSRFRESVKNFKIQPEKPIYHFATHAVTNDTLPEYSYLAFAPRESTEEFILYAKDLYAEQLDAAMVVLSACETGLGTLTTGQGMQSLAQGFMYGGASSLVYSKWSVSDKQTAVVMSLFYEFLDDGLPKDHALQKAKLTYLEMVDDPILRHPFYWASFVFSGDSVPLGAKPLLPIWLWWILGFVSILGVVVFIKKR